MFEIRSNARMRMEIAYAFGGPSFESDMADRNGISIADSGFKPESCREPWVRNKGGSVENTVRLRDRTGKHASR
jgi:hypothetical protein